MHVYLELKKPLGWTDGVVQILLFIFPSPLAEPRVLCHLSFGRTLIIPVTNQMLTSLISPPSFSILLVYHLCLSSLSAAEMLCWSAWQYQYWAAGMSAGNKKAFNMQSLLPQSFLEHLKSTLHINAALLQHDCSCCLVCEWCYFL